LHDRKIRGFSATHLGRFGVQNIKVLCAKPVETKLLGDTGRVRVKATAVNTLRTAVHLESVVSGSANSGDEMKKSFFSWSLTCAAMLAFSLSALAQHGGGGMGRGRPAGAGPGSTAMPADVGSENVGRPSDMGPAGPQRVRLAKSRQSCTV
jgi:hypothetical protein